METRAAGQNDSWAAYTDVETEAGDYEIRHPKPPLTTYYTVWRWSDKLGPMNIGHFYTLAEAVAFAQNR